MSIFRVYWRLATLPLARYWLRPFHDWWSRRLWAALEAEPGFNAAMREAEADIEAGRWYDLDGNPNPDWPRAGPQP